MRSFFAALRKTRGSQNRDISVVTIAVMYICDMRRRVSGVCGFIIACGGERGIRTPDPPEAGTRFPSVLLQPLGHLSLLVRKVYGILI